jgi:beta-aspartyl-peptidase (threonine type)
LPHFFALMCPALLVFFAVTDQRAVVSEGMSIRPGVIVHGGAGLFSSDRHAAARKGCSRAVEVGLTVLAEGGSALDAAQAAVVVLEDDPEFNAGIGSVLSRAGTAEMDAAIMDGTSLSIGGVAAMPNARNAIVIARAVLDANEHALLCADGAWAFARERGFEPCDPSEVITDRARARLDSARAKSAIPTAEGISDLERGGGTVGACAVDAQGRVATATSTGGMTFKRTGRIGDTPLAGCGTYADDRAGAASATGNGEAIIRVTMTRQCVDAMRAGASASEAAWVATRDLGERTGKTAGIICCDRTGRLGAAHNTQTMAMAGGIVGGDIVTEMAVDDGYDVMAVLLG